MLQTGKSLAANTNVCTFLCWCWDANIMIHTLKNILKNKPYTVSLYHDAPHSVAHHHTHTRQKTQQSTSRPHANGATTHFPPSCKWHNNPLHALMQMAQQSTSRPHANGATMHFMPSCKSCQNMHRQSKPSQETAMQHLVSKQSKMISTDQMFYDSVPCKTACDTGSATCHKWVQNLVPHQ